MVYPLCSLFFHLPIKAETNYLAHLMGIHIEDIEHLIINRKLRCVVFGSDPNIELLNY